MQRTATNRVAARPRRGGGRALTLPELIISLAMTALVGLGAVGLITVARQAWAHDPFLDAQSPSQLHRQRLVLEQMIRFAPGAGYTVPGYDEDEPALLFLWANDSLDHLTAKPGDQKPQWYEMRLLRHDRDSQRLVLMMPRPWSQLSAAERAEAADLVRGIDSQVRAETFMDLPWVRTVSLFGGHDGWTVTDVQFEVIWHQAGRPYLNYEIDAERAGHSRTLRGTVALRVPSSEDDSELRTLISPLNLLGL